MENKILIKKEYLYLIKRNKERKNIYELDKEEMISELNAGLDDLFIINSMIEKCKNEYFNEQDYINYLNLLEKENYEELIKYKLI